MLSLVVLVVDFVKVLIHLLLVDDIEIFVTLLLVCVDLTSLHVLYLNLMRDHRATLLTSGVTCFQH